MNEKIEIVLQELMEVEKEQEKNLGTKIGHPRRNNMMFVAGMSVEEKEKELNLLLGEEYGFVTEKQ
ncbi:MAG: hypothetical protein WCO23_05055 [bacterium]